MSDGKLLVNGLQTLQAKFEAEGIEIGSLGSGKVVRGKGPQASVGLAFKLEVYVPLSVLSELESKIIFRDTVSEVQGNIQEWQTKNPNATSEEIAECQNRYITWGAENSQIDKDELAGAVLGHIDRQQSRKATA